MAIDINALWDYSKPELSEQTFVAAMDGANQNERLVLQTQIARTHGLRREFKRARAILLSIEPSLVHASEEVQVRFYLELGRTYASPAHPEAELTAEDRQTAGIHFLKAFEVAKQAQLDFLAIDALHMMPNVDPTPERQLEWDQKAIAYMEQSEQPDAKKWEGSLRNNFGYALRLKGDYESAISQFKLSKAAYDRAGRSENVRIADWMIARTYREQKKYLEALDIQLRLERAWDADGKPDPEVFEELEELYRALADEAKARHYRDRQKSAR